MSSFLDNIRAAVEPCLAIRDEIGVAKDQVFLVTRTWYTDAALTIPDTQTQNGYASDMEEQLLPSPNLKTYYADIDLPTGGSIKKGDIKLTGVSRASYRPGDVDGKTVNPNEERLFRVGGKMYQVIMVAERVVTLEIRLRLLTNQQRYA